MRTLLALSLCFAAAAQAQPVPQPAQEEDDHKPSAKIKEAADQPMNPAMTPPMKPAPDSDSDGAGVKLNPEGVYGGVSPGAQNLPPRPPRLPLKRGPQRLTWSGFQVKDGVPTVFLEVTGAPDYTVDQRKDALVVTLKNTVVPIKNNRRPLRVEAFNTPVKTVETEGKGRNVRVLIHTKEPGVHRERVEPAAGGFQMLVIELGARPSQ